MKVVATAGHVDHGKSTLVRTLTGIEPDRWSEERRRGLTIDLGFAWTELPCGETIAFVDVPGHQRFVRNMLAGIGEVPAVLFVVAADEGWMPQSEEHLQALHALGVARGLLVITRADLADPERALLQARTRLSETSLAGIPAATFGSTTGRGESELGVELETLVGSLPDPSPTGDVRLWLDRVFSVRGAGTVVTATLPSGELTVGEELVVGRTGRRVVIRDLRSLGEPVQRARATARVALNLRGAHVDELERGDTLLTPRAWWTTDSVDVRLTNHCSAELARELTTHIGSAAVRTRVRPLGADTARLSLDRPLPLRIGDRALLRDAGRHHVPSGVTVLDVRPPALRRRGAAAARARELDGYDEHTAGGALLARHGALRATRLLAMGATAPPDAHGTGDWLLDARAREGFAARLVELLEQRRREQPLAEGLPEREALRALGLEDRALLDLVLRSPQAAEITSHGGKLLLGASRAEQHLPEGIAALRARLHERPFRAPTAEELRELELDRKQLAAAATAGKLLGVGDGVYLLPDALQLAVRRLAELPSPFTPAQAREALNTTRRVTMPLLERLAKEGHTLRLPDGTHRLRRTR
ncbi:selenocysteine-specific elongation factor [Actinopolyspora biskrensis]|uniref:Selenocysteine-specific elongation factor n=1 Tax=Actinopolyspora biskrensis TaxID=1470178 RepID=A0A852Z1L3_9ACTN|nr:selenocysteine-specific translation elongation factor [Actinopolyspora biskrensis]NYH81134.1 selenocysteine-specific elongation factor [Actinopolyspora biskrensis]